MYIRTHSHATSRKLVAPLTHKGITQRKLRRFYTKSRKRIIRYGLLTANAALLGVVVFFVVKAPSSSQALRQNAVVDVSSSSDVAAGPLDQVSSADIAVHIARTAGLPEANSVVNHADTVSSNDAIAPADTSVVSKPQVVTAALPSRKDIQTYTVVPGDSVSSIATKFGISSDSIRGSNGLTGNTIAIGKQITLPPTGTNGVVYTVKAGDTPDSLAQKFSASKEAIISFNDAEVSGLQTGEQILIPDGVVRATPVAAYNYYSGSGFAWGGSAPVYSSNGYDYGWCTWWAAKRRADIGMPLPSNLGNAISWRYLAPRAGLGVDGTPSSGAVAWYKSIGGLGHVGFVERVNDDGSIWISDMNYSGVSQIDGSTPAGGWGRTSYHLVAAGELGSFLFIH